MAVTDEGFREGRARLHKEHRGLCNAHSVSKPTAPERKSVPKKVFEPFQRSRRRLLQQRNEKEQTEEWEETRAQEGNEERKGTKIRSELAYYTL